MTDKSKPPDIDVEGLKEESKKDPKSKKWNNPNSRKNLKQYRPLIPKLEDSSVADDEESDVAAIVVGRKLNPEIVRKLMPQRGVLTAAEKKRFIGVVQQFLGDFKNEEPSATDLDDIFEIAEADIMKTRLLHASKDSPDTLVVINQSLERIYKRKQTAKENLSARRSDRKDTRNSQDINIVDLIVRYDLVQKKIDEDRIASLLSEEEETQIKLEEVLNKDGY